MFYPKALLLLMFFLLVKTVHATSPTDIDSLTERWLNTERQSRALENNWRENKPLMQQQIDLLKAEKKQLQSVLALTDSDHGNVEQRRSQLLAEQSQLEHEQQVLNESLQNLVKTLEGLAHTLPPPVKLLWDHEDSAVTHSSDSSITLQVALAKLAALTEFNQRISINESIILTPNKEKVLVKQIYMGASIAWFSSSDGSFVGKGESTNGEWQWHFDSNLPAEDILKAIAIYEKKQSPELIRLPLNLKSILERESD